MEYYREGWAQTLDPHFKELKLQEELEEHVRYLAGKIGERNYQSYHNLQRTISYICEYWARVGYQVQAQHYEVDGRQFTNLWVEIEGSTRPQEIVVVGAHYDSVVGTPGADDNASAVAGLLALSGRAHGKRGECTLRFVAFANEEPPFFMSPTMGSLVYARGCQARGDDIQAMVCLEMLGYYCEKQPETLGLLPERGDFIALVGNPQSEELVKRAARAFHQTVKFPLQAAAPCTNLVPYASFSDHWSFWQCGYPAFMVTDTGPMRNPHYHLPSDLPETLDYERMTMVVFGVEGVLQALRDCHDLQNE